MQKLGRLWEIDFLRGIAIVLMVIFNYSFTLRFFNIYTIEGGRLYWNLFPRLIASMFISIIGVSLVLSYSRVKNKPKKYIYLKYLKRGLGIFGLGLGITLATWLFFPNEFILFGILHLIGISIVLSIPFLKFRKLTLILGSFIIGAGIYLQSFRFDFPYLLWLGFTPKNFYTFDYFPLLPWFGVTLFGLYLGNLFYTNGKRNFKIKDRSKSSIVKPFSFLGRHSLLVYLLHQPVLVLILLILGLV